MRMRVVLLSGTVGRVRAATLMNSARMSASEAAALRWGRLAASRQRPAIRRVNHEDQEVPSQGCLWGRGGTAIRMAPSGFHGKPVKRFALNHSVKIQAAANRRTKGNLSPRPYRHASPAAIAGKMARYRESRTTAP